MINGHGAMGWVGFLEVCSNLCDSVVLFGVIEHGVMVGLGHLRGLSNHNDSMALLRAKSVDTAGWDGVEFGDLRFLFQLQ